MQIRFCLCVIQKRCDRPQVAQCLVFAKWNMTTNKKSRKSIQENNWTSNFSIKTINCLPMGFLLRQYRRLWGELKAKIQRKEGKCVHLGWKETKHKLHHTRVAESTEWAKCTSACELDIPPPRVSSTYHARVTFIFALAFRVLPKFETLSE